MKDLLIETFVEKWLRIDTHNTSFNTITGLKYITSGWGIVNYYTGINLSPRNFTINLILLQYSHLELGYTLDRNIPFLYICVCMCLLFNTLLSLLPRVVRFLSPNLV